MVNLQLNTQYLFICLGKFCKENNDLIIIFSLRRGIKECSYKYEHVQLCKCF